MPNSLVFAAFDDERFKRVARRAAGYLDLSVLLARQGCDNTTMLAAAKAELSRYCNSPSFIESALRILQYQQRAAIRRGYL